MQIISKIDLHWKMDGRRKLLEEQIEQYEAYILKGNEFTN